MQMQDTINIFQQLGLKYNPFSIATDIRNFYWDEKRRIILEELYHGIILRKGFLVLCGDAGLGKTSISLQLLQLLKKENITTAWIFNPILNYRELLSTILRDFGLSVPQDLSSIQDTLYRFFIQEYQKNKTCVILIDEAHHLDFKCLEALRMLSNLEWQGQKLVQIVLVAQPEFKQTLAKPELRQLKTRIVIFLELSPFSLAELREYVNFKLISAQAPFRVKGSALKLLWKASQGNPRLINLIMERACYALFIQEKPFIDTQIIKMAISDLEQLKGSVLANGEGNFIGKFILLFSCILLMVLGLVQEINQESVFKLEHKKVLATSNTYRRKMIWTVIDSNQPNQTNKIEQAKITPQQKQIEKPTILVSKQNCSANFANSSLTTEINGTLTFKKSFKPLENLNSRQDLLQRSDQLLLDIVQFLQPFHLIDLRPVLFQALQTHNLDLLKTKLPDSLQLLLFENTNLSLFKKQNWSNFPWKKYSLTGPAQIVLWRPKICIFKKCYQEKTRHVELIQRILKKQGYLEVEPTGFLGPKTKLAIIRLQKDYKLPANGRLTFNTMFILEQLGAQ